MLVYDFLGGYGIFLREKKSTEKLKPFCIFSDLKKRLKQLWIFSDLKAEDKDRRLLVGLQIF